MLLLLLLAAAPAGGVLETRLETSVRGTGALEATAHYRLVLSEPVEHLPLALLEMEGSRVEAIEAAAGETPLTVSLEPGDSPQRRGHLDTGALRPGSVEIVIRYSVSSAVQGNGDGLVARLPVPVLGLPSGGARAEAFTATIALPRGFELTESFPAGFARRGDAYAGSLPLVPAFVLARAAPGARLLTFDRAIDWGVLLLLGGLGGLGLARGLRTLSP